MKDHTPASVRLDVLLARRSSLAVVLRRGPSKRVRLVRWQRSDDTFERGQWFAGRIYAHRCDLSPNGERFCYFAGAYKRDPATWTAVSKPPYFSALAMWPKGDAWGGGGLFASDNHLELNHGPSEAALASGFKLPGSFRVTPLRDHAGRGEDFPIHHLRLVRDGWQRVRDGVQSEYSWDGDVAWEYTTSQVYAKPSPLPHRLRLERHLHGVYERNGPWYVYSFEVHDEARGARHDLGRIDWADWDRGGDLLYAKEGCLYRVRHGNRAITQALQEPVRLIDLRDDRFERVAPPEHALRWKG